MPIQFFSKDVDLLPNHKKKLSDFLLQLFEREKRPVEEVHYIFCTDAYLLDLNQKYLNHDTYTDILTFDLSEEQDRLIAEIYISADRVKENAQKFGTSVENELHRVIFHGALHLCGYDDHSEEDKKLMRQKEDESIAAYLK